LQGLLLVLPLRGLGRRVMTVLSAAGFLGAAAALFVAKAHAGEPFTWFGMLQEQPLLRLPRCALFLSGLLLGRSIVYTKELPQGRKQEVLFLLSVLALLCDLLVLSVHSLLSCILLVTIAWLGIFLSGLAFRGRTEGEAVLKYWMQSSVSVALAFGSVLVLAVVSGGAHYDVISRYVQAQAAYSPEILLVILVLFLPYFLVGGIFPFHFALVDRDQGLPWSVQLVLSVMVRGAIFLAVWKTGVEVFGHSRAGSISEGLRVLQIAGLAGGFWLALFALSQNNSKRLFSAMVTAQWSAVLGAGALPSALGLSAVTYAFAAIFLWSALLGFTWARLQELAGDDSLAAVYGSARIFRSAGLVLLVSLAGPLCVPGFAGLPSILHLLAAMIEQRSLVFLLAEGALLALVALSCLRVGTDLLFRRFTGWEVPASALRYGALDAGAMALLGGTLLLWGVLGNQIFLVLEASAKAFL
jgi:NADH:ubiquinone oxidoreductase subunit 2 (subunit N)